MGVVLDQELHPPGLRRLEPEASGVAHSIDERPGTRKIPPWLSDSTYTGRPGSNPESALQMEVSKDFCEAGRVGSPPSTEPRWRREHLQVEHLGLGLRKRLQQPALARTCRAADHVKAIARRKLSSSAAT